MGRIVRRERDDRDACGATFSGSALLLLADELRGREPVHPRHVQVHHDQVEVLRGGTRDGFRAAPRPHRRAAERRQAAFCHGRIHRLVLDEQHVAVQRGFHLPGGRGRVRNDGRAERGGKPLVQGDPVHGLQHDALVRHARTQPARLHFCGGRNHDEPAADGPGGAEQYLEGARMSTRVDHHDLGVVRVRVFGQHVHAQRERMTRERFGERGPARQDAHGSGEPRRRLRLRQGAGFQRQLEAERGADLRLAFHGQAAAHHFGQLAADGEPEPRAAELAGRALVALHERLEDPADRRRIHPDPGVPDREPYDGAIRLDGLDVRLDGHFAPLRELHGVADQVHEDLAHPERVAEQRVRHGPGRTDDQLDTLRLGRAREQARALLEHLAEIDRQRLEPDLPRADFRKIEQVVDDLQEHLRRRADRLREVRLRRRKRGAGEKLGHADDAVHRRAQLVTHAVEEVALGLHGLGELLVRRLQLARAQLHLGFEALPGLCHFTKLLPVAMDPLRDQREQREGTDRVGDGRGPRRGIAMDGQAQRRRAPHGIGIGRADFEQVVAGIEIGERDAALRAEIDPVFGQAGHAVGELVVRGRREIQHAELERDDAAAVVELDAVAQPERRRAFRPHAEHLHVGQREARRPPVFLELRRVEEVEPAGPAEGQAAVAQPEVRAEGELLALQAVLAVVALHGTGRGGEPHQAGVAGKPEMALCIGDDAPQRVARKAVFARQDLEFDRVRRGGGIDHARESAAARRDPHVAAFVHGERIHRVRRERRRILRVVAENLEHRPVGAREIEALAFRAEPEVAARILDDGRHDRRADRARGGTVRQVANGARDGIQDVGAAAEGADPERAAVRLGNRHDAFGAERARIARLHRDRFDTPVGSEHLEPAAHRADPERAAPVAPQRRHALVAQRILTADDCVQRGGAAGRLVEADEPVEGGDPHPVVAGILEAEDRLVLEPGGTIAAELPAARVPAAHAAAARADPDQPGRVLVQRHHERVAQRGAVVRVVAVMRERAGGAIEQVEAVGGADPQAARAIFEQGAHVVAGERCRSLRLVPEGFDDAAAAVGVQQARGVRRDPQRAVPGLEYARNLPAVQRSGAETGQRAGIGAPPVQSAVGADPDIAGAIEREVGNPVARERVGILRIVAKVLDVSRPRVQHVDTGIERADPHVAARVDEHRAHPVAGDRASVVLDVPVAGEAIGVPIPPCNAVAVQCDPETAVLVLDDLPDVIAGKGTAFASRVRVTVKLAPVVAYEPVLGAEPDEALAILQARHDGRLRQPVLDGEMLEEQRRSVGRRSNRRSEHPQQSAQDTREDPARPAPAGIASNRGHAVSFLERDRQGVDALQESASAAVRAGTAAHSGHSLGTQEAIDAGLLPENPDGRDSHHGSVRLHVYPRLQV